jgi:hypothetical protein
MTTPSGHGTQAGVIELRGHNQTLVYQLEFAVLIDFTLNHL